MCVLLLLICVFTAVAPNAFINGAPTAQVKTLSELISKQEMVVVLTHYMNTYVHKHRSWSSGILIMLGVLAVVGYICKV